MDAGVWQRRRTTYENTVLGAASALFGFFCLWNGFRGNTSAGKLMICHVKSGTRHPTVETRRSWTKPGGGGVRRDKRYFDQHVHVSQAVPLTSCPAQKDQMKDLARLEMLRESIVNLVALK